MTLFAAALLEKQIVIVCSNLVLIKASQCSGLLNFVLYYITHQLIFNCDLAKHFLLQQ